MSSCRPTLLVFTLGPAGECARRRLLPGRLRGEEMELRRAWLAAALEAGRQAGCELLVSSPADLDLPADARRLPQHGPAFGDRLATAVRQAQAVADGPLVVVGSDSPGLSADHVRQALRRLHEDPQAVVVGPARDGGLYLLAAHRDLAGLLRTVSWCHSRTLLDLRRALGGERIRCEFLDPQHDLDTPADLERWLARPGADGPRWRSWLRALRVRLAALRRPWLPHRVRIHGLDPLPVRAGRAPPSPVLP